MSHYNNIHDSSIANDIDVTTGYDKTGGKIVENHLRNGVLIKMVLFRSNNVKRYEKHFGNGKTPDKELFFDKEGQIRYEGKFIKCQKNGIGIYYDKSGRRRYKGDLKKGLYNGFGKSYDED